MIATVIGWAAGEPRNWNAANGVFSGLNPAQPLNFDGDGWGAWNGRFAKLRRIGLQRRVVAPRAAFAEISKSLPCVPSSHSDASDCLKEFLE
jgi:hypothetical protein